MELVRETKEIYRNKLIIQHLNMYVPEPGLIKTMAGK